MNKLTIDPEFKALIPPLAADEQRQLEENLLSEGCRDALVTWNGVIIDGHNRYDICLRHGIDFRTTERAFATRNDAKLWMVRNQMGRRNLNDFQRTEIWIAVKPVLVEKAKANMSAGGKNKGLSNLTTPIIESIGGVRDQIAELADVASGTVYKVEKILRESDPVLINAVRNGDVSINEAYHRTKNKQFFTGIEPHQLINSSKSNEYYTPIEFIDSAYAVMGHIDLDPASCEEANENVRAQTYYTIEEDGFNKPWSGRVWMNPPYGKDEGESEGNQARWVRKICDEYAAGNVSEACVLVNAVPGNKWFHPLWDHTICFVYRRIHFINGSGAPTHSNAIVYLGKNIAAFSDEFKKHGAVVRRIDA